MLMLALIGGLTGCVSQRTGGARHVGSGEITSEGSKQATVLDLESSARQLMEQMLAHPQFSANYNAVKAEKGGKLPVVVIGNIANKTTERVQGHLDATGDTIRTTLFSSGLFDVKDDAATGAIIARMSDNIHLGLEDGSLAKAFGRHAAPDFIVLGDLRHFAEAAGAHTYRLRIAIHNLRTGKIVWEGIQTKVKL